MLRISSAIAVGLALISAFVLYAVSYETRHLDTEVAAKERRIERLRSDIAVLKAERAFLSRPERIEPLARAMGFVPAEGSQYVELDSLKQSDAPPGQRPSSR
ncbi:MAG TPA: cell division protein FtsL [Hyphomicrobiaceae bacterium]|jgi:cell division protein FtsL